MRPLPKYHPTFERDVRPIDAFIFIFSLLHLQIEKKCYSWRTKKFRKNLKIILNNLKWRDISIFYLHEAFNYDHDD